MPKLWDEIDGELWLENPKKRRRTNKRRKSSARSRNAPKRRSYSMKRNPPRRRRRRRNPPPLSGAFTDALYAFAGHFGVSFLTPRVSGVVGVDTTGLLKPVTQFAVAYGLGFAADKFLSRSVSQMVFVGGILKALQDFASNQFNFSVGEFSYGPTMMQPGTEAGYPALGAGMPDMDYDMGLPERLDSMARLT